MNNIVLHLSESKPTTTTAENQPHLQAASQAHEILVNFEKARFALQTLGSLLLIFSQETNATKMSDVHDTDEILNALCESYKFCRYKILKQMQFFRKFQSFLIKYI